MRAALLLVVIVAGGCASAPPSPFAGTAWTLDRIVAPDGDVVRGSGDERLMFGADGRLRVASCNECSGPYRLRGESLSVRSALACTRRGCAEGQIELERYVQGDLAMRREGSYLVLETTGAEGGATQLLFSSEPAEAAPAEEGP